MSLHVWPPVPAHELGQRAQETLVENDTPSTSELQVEMPGLMNIIRKPLHRRRFPQPPSSPSATSPSSESTVSELPSPRRSERRPSWEMVEVRGLGERAGRSRPFATTPIEEDDVEGDIGLAFSTVSVEEEVVEGTNAPVEEVMDTGKGKAVFEESAILDAGSEIKINLDFDNVSLSSTPPTSPPPGPPSPTLPSPHYKPVATANSPHPARYSHLLKNPYWDTYAGSSRAAEQRLTKQPSKQDNEIRWAVAKAVEGLKEVQDGMRECYALMAPIDQGVVLPVTSPKSEAVKGTVTRIGTRITKGRLVLNLKTTGRREFDISGDHDIHIPALESLHQNLNTSLDKLHTITTSTLPEPRDFLASLTSLHTIVNSSVDLLIGTPSSSSLKSTLNPLALTNPPHTATHRTNALPQGSQLSQSTRHANSPPPPSWTLLSLPTNAFTPNLGSHLSLHLSIRDACLILTVRALEPAHEPVHFGTRLGLAFGTVRRLEHDEMEQKFEYKTRVEGSKETMEEVWVREKVGVDAPDAHLISIQSKLKSCARDLEGLIRIIQAVLGQDTIE